MGLARYMVRNWCNRSDQALLHVCNIDRVLMIQVRTRGTGTSPLGSPPC